MALRRPRSPIVPAAGFRILLCATVLLLGGCGGGAGIRYYLIDAEPGPVLRVADGATIEVVDLVVPQYLERFQIATRDGGNVLDYAASDQWGEPLRKNLVRVLAAHLSAVLGTADVATPFNRLASVPELRLLVHVDRFERGADGRVALHGRWQITRGAQAPVVATQAARVDVPVRGAAGDAAALVGAMQDAFAEFSQRIAASLTAALEAS